jgi:hypothetical protein
LYSTIMIYRSSERLSKTPCLHSFISHPHVLYPQGQSKTWNIYIIIKRNLLLILPTSGGWKSESSYLPGSGAEPLNCMTEHALESVHEQAELARQT